jgi:hypothetical protein
MVYRLLSYRSCLCVFVQRLNDWLHLKDGALHRYQAGNVKGGTKAYGFGTLQCYVLESMLTFQVISSM